MSESKILNVLNLYAAALDSHQWDLFDEVFTEDVEADYPGVLHWRDLASFKREFGPYHEALANHQHIMSNHQVLVRGDRANTLTYGSFRLVERGPSEDDDNVREGCCWYDDEFVETGSGWRIRKRVARVFWARGRTPGRAVTEGGGVSMMAGPSLPAEAAAGRVAYFNALRARA